MEDIRIQQGARPEESPYPLPEFALGNVVKLKRPFPFHGHLGERRYRYGLIVEHLRRNAWGIPKVSLHLFDGRGRIFIEQGTHSIPTYADFVASEFIIWHLVGTMFYQVVNEGKGFDLYPTCQKCKNRQQNPFNENRCSACGGWGHVRVMRRLPKKFYGNKWQT